MAEEKKGFELLAEMTKDCFVPPIAVVNRLTDVERSALSRLKEWREADRELFVAKATLSDLADGPRYTDGAIILAQRRKVEKLQAIELEKRALAMAAADRLLDRGEGEER